MHVLKTAKILVKIKRGDCKLRLRLPDGVNVTILPDGINFLVVKYVLRLRSPDPHRLPRRKPHAIY